MDFMLKVDTILWTLMLTIRIKGTPPDLISPKTGCRFYDRCPKAFEKCKEDPPKFKTDSGYVMCWLYE